LNASKPEKLYKWKVTVQSKTDRFESFAMHLALEDTLANYLATASEKQSCKLLYYGILSFYVRGNFEVEKLHADIAYLPPVPSDVEIQLVKCETGEGFVLHA
jgi:hypothetical protein